MKSAIILVLCGALFLAAAPASAGVYDCMINCYLHSGDTGQCVAKCGLEKSVKPPLPFDCGEMCKDVFKRCSFTHKQCMALYQKCQSDCAAEKKQEQKTKK